MPLQVRSLLPFDLDPGVGLPIRAAHLSYRVTDEVICSGPGLLGWTVDRATFDALLVEQARAAGAHFRDACEVGALHRVPDGWEIDAGGETLRSRLIVGADGVASRVASSLGIRLDPPAVTIEAAVEVSEEQWRRGEGRVRFDFGCVDSGYAWTFAKSDHFSVGVYSARPVSGRILGECLERYVSRDPWVSGGRISEVRRWFVPRATGRARKLHGDRGLVVGDAAGLCDPLTGEGIRHALHSAELAAPVLLEALDVEQPELDGYSDSVDRVLRPGFRVARVCSLVAFMREGRLIGRFLRSGFAERAWGRLARGEIAYPRFRWGLLPLLAWLPFLKGRRGARENSSVRT